MDINVIYTAEKGNVLQFDLESLLSQLSPEDKKTLACHLACFDDVIAEVSFQLIEGQTSDGSYGATMFESEAEPHTALDKATRAISKASSDIAKRNIEQLETYLKIAQDHNATYCKENASLRCRIYELENKQRELETQLAVLTAPVKEV